MKGFLLDTNVISEVTKTQPNLQVVTFLTRSDELWLPTIAWHELEFGLQLMPQRSLRRDQLRAILRKFVAEYEDRVLSLDRTGAEWAAQFRAQARRSGRVLDLGDALIAGTAKAHDLAVATRNIGDFDGLDVEVADPWQILP